MVLLWQSSAFLLRLGFFPQHAGFGYLACAISSIAANPMNYYGHGSDIFGILESEYGISRAKATRCMRYSIAIAWQSQENKEFHALFKSYGDEFPPPVSEFIFRSAFEIRSAQIRESETDNSISSVFKPWNCNSKQDFSCCAPTWRQTRQAQMSRKPNPKQPDNDSFCGKASFCSTFLQRNRSAGHKTNAESGIRPNNLCPCFCAGIFKKMDWQSLVKAYARAFVRAFCFPAVLTPVMLRTNLIFNEN